MTQAFIDLEISHEEFKIILNEKEKYDQMKKHIRNARSKSELFFLCSCIKWLLLLLKDMEVQEFTK